MTPPRGRPEPETADEAVVGEVLGGAKEQFRVIIERYQDKVFNLVRRLVGPGEASDVVQEAFLKAYIHLDQFDATYRFGNWILKIAQNQAFSHLRHKGVRRERLALEGEGGSELEAVADESPLNDPEGMAESRGTQDQLERAVMRLPEKYRLLVHLRHAEARQYQEIAQTLGMPLGTVKFRLHVAYRLLRDILVEQGMVT